MYNAEKVAKAFHETYERLAPAFGYKTRSETALSWSDIPLPYKDLMVAVAKELIDSGLLLPGSGVGTTDLNFGQVLHGLQRGVAFARQGWNGKGQFIFHVPGSAIRVEADRPLGIAMPDMVGRGVAYLPHIDIMTTRGTVVPWFASQTDVLATDWYRVY